MTVIADGQSLGHLAPCAHLARCAPMAGMTMSPDSSPRVFGWWHQSLWGYAAVIGTVLISYALWLGSMWYYDDWYDEPWTYIAKIGSHGATLLMCWAFLLATRFKVIERLFGGLDTVYAAHRHIGIAAFALIVLHPLGLAMPFLGDWAAWFGFFLPSSDSVRNTGLIALVGFAVLLVLSLLASVVPYDRWKRSHELFGLIFAVIILHALLAPGEITRYPALQVWFAIWAILAALAILYTRLLNRWIGPQYSYRVAASTMRSADTVDIELAPIGRRMHHRPGQFLYISLNTHVLSRELHPFTISSPPEAAHLRLSIKKVGDWTANIDRIAIGDTARVWGPYGLFSEPLYRQPHHEVVMLGGGIGITPFLGMLASQEFSRRPGRSWLIYGVTKAEEGIFLDELTAHTTRLPQLSVHLHVSDEKGYVDRAYLATVLGTDTGWEARLYLICGPSIMSSTVSEQLRAAGVPAAAIITENFVLR